MSGTRLRSGVKLITCFGGGVEGKQCAKRVGLTGTEP